MKKFIVIAVALTAVTGCTKVVEVKTPVPASTRPPTTQPSGSSTSDVRREVLNSVENLREVPILMTDDEIWQMSQLVCDEVTNGASVQDLIDIFYESASGDDMIIRGWITIAAVAIAVVCPENGYIFDELQNNA